MDNSEAVSAVLTLVFCLGAVLFYVLLYRSRIVPRWIVMWGLLAIPLYAAGGFLAVYAISDSDSTTASLLDLPLAVQEMVLAVWMLVRGFRPASVQVSAATPGGMGDHAVLTNAASAERTPLPL